MAKRTGWNLQAQSLFVAIAVVAFVVAAQTSVVAQNQPRTYKPGDRVTDGTYVYEIIRCLGESEWDECEYRAYRDDQPVGPKTNRMIIRHIRAMEKRVLDDKEREAKARGENTNSNPNTAKPDSSAPPNTNVSPAPPGNKPAPGGRVAGLDGKWKVGDKLEANHRSFWYPAQIIAIQSGKYKVHYEGAQAINDELVDEFWMRPIGGHQITAECGYELPGDVSRTARPSEQLFKKKIWQRYSFRSKKGGSPSASAADDIGIAFLTFQMGKAITNTVAVVPGIGATRRNNGAPPNATMYPVKTKFVICEKYGEKLDRYLHDEEMACFKDKYGEWICDGVGVPKRTPID